MAAPPEGALVGEDVPRENEQDEAREAAETRLYRTLKARHGGEVADDVLRQKARELAERAI